METQVAEPEAVAGPDSDQPLPVDVALQNLTSPDTLPPATVLPVAEEGEVYQVPHADGEVHTGSLDRAAEACPYIAALLARAGAGEATKKLAMFDVTRHLSMAEQLAAKGRAKRLDEEAAARPKPHTQNTPDTHAKEKERVEEPEVPSVQLFVQLAPEPRVVPAAIVAAHTDVHHQKTRPLPPPPSTALQPDVPRPKVIAETPPAAYGTAYETVAAAKAPSPNLLAYDEPAFRVELPGQTLPEADSAPASTTEIIAPTRSEQLPYDEQYVAAVEEVFANWLDAHQLEGAAESLEITTEEITDSSGSDAETVAFEADEDAGPVSVAPIEQAERISPAQLVPELPAETQAAVHAILERISDLVSQIATAAPQPLDSARNSPLPDMQPFIDAVEALALLDAESPVEPPVEAETNIEAEVAMQQLEVCCIQLLEAFGLRAEPEAVQVLMRRLGVVVPGTQLLPEAETLFADSYIEHGTHERKQTILTAVLQHVTQVVQQLQRFLAAGRYILASLATPSNKMLYMAT